MRILLLSIFLLSTTAVFAQNSNVAVEGPAPKIDPANTTLRARVFYEDTGRPVKRTSVMLISNGPVGEMNGLTDNEGNLEIRNLRAGKYYAIINAPGVVTPLAYLDILKGRPENIEEHLTEFPPIVVNGLTDITVQIPAKRGGAISGRVMYPDGDPAIGVKVEILRKNGDHFTAPMSNMSVVMSLFTGGAGMFQTDDRGMYRFAGLPAGEYIVKATENVVHTKSSRQGFDAGFEALLFGTGSMVNVFFENALEQSKAQTLNVQFGQELSEINITLPDRALHSLEGKVVAAKDKLPIRNARVSIKREGNVEIEVSGGYGRELQTMHTDEKGNWKFTDLPAGTYHVTVEAGSSEFDEKDQAYGRTVGHAANAVANAMNTAVNAVMDAEGGRVVRRSEKPPAPKFAKKSREFVLSDKDLSEQLIEMSYGATIIGTITVDGGKDKPESVTLVASSERGEPSSSEHVSFYDYQSEKPDLERKKDFRLEAIGEGKSHISIHPSDDGYYVKSAASNQVDLLKGPIQLREGETLANIQIVLSNDTGTLKGTLIDEEKQPVPGMQITFVPTDSTKLRTSTYYRIVRSNQNGEFSVKLPPFEYAVVFFPTSLDTKKPEDFYAWLASAVKQAKTFKIEAGQTTETTIKRTRQTLPK